MDQEPSDIEATYARRFGPDLAWRRQIWEILCHDFFQRYVPAGATVLELGAGYCELINAIEATRRIAVDINPDTVCRAAAGVEVMPTRSTDLSALGDATVDVVFASNLFEHLGRGEILGTLREAARVLRPMGRIVVLQPNIRFCGRDYWMFFDHVTPLDDRSLCEAMELAGFRIVECVPRFLPFTTRSRLPQTPLLVKLYLRLRPAWRLFGAQALIVGAPQARNVPGR